MSLDEARFVYHLAGFSGDVSACLLDHRRPDILVHNPYGGGRQVIIEVALTATTGQTRTN